MNHVIYCKGIGLPREAINCIEQVSFTEEEYSELKQIFYRDIPDFQQRVLVFADWRQRFLYLYTRLASETWKIYQQKGISDKIFWDTFYDQKIWYENCVQVYKEPGLAEYDWLWHPIQLRLFRLGRLQFMPIALKKPLVIKDLCLSAGATILDTHIPQGEPLEAEAVKTSFQQALSFFPDVYPVFSCHSWLIYPELQRILPADSRILQFQRLFQVIEKDDTDHQAEERIFGCFQKDPSSYPENTTLQRSAKRFLLEGNKLGIAMGIHVSEIEDSISNP